MHLHRRFHEMRAQRAFGYLQLAILKRYAIVVTNDAFFLDAQSFGQIQTSRGEEYSIAYKAHLVSNEWKVYDVVAENISLVNNYRSQFNRVISGSSYEELLRRLKDKAEFAGAPKK